VIGLNEQIKGILRKYYGYDDFRPGQEEVINGVLTGRDTLAVMPTGAGKSLCFQLPALIFDGISLIISPLISLMRDQVAALAQNGVKAAYINSSLTTNQTEKVIANASRGFYKIIYAAPERLDIASFVNFARNAYISMVAVDEAHCVSQWGQDFRPSYLNIAKFIALLPKRPVVTAFTATATREVKDDIVRLLRLNDPLSVTTGFNRENLYFDVRRPAKKYDELRRYMQKNGDKYGIIYCATRKTVDEVTEKLNDNGFSACAYHAGLSKEERGKSQDDFVFDRKNVIVATNAFGIA
jgi:ATP-dependent DNA helicase RecQ